MRWLIVEDTTLTAVLQKSIVTKKDCSGTRQKQEVVVEVKKNAQVLDPKLSR